MRVWSKIKVVLLIATAAAGSRTLIFLPGQEVLGKPY